MKTFVSLLLSVLIVSLVYVLCKKSDFSSARQDKAIPQQVLNDIKALGFSTQNVIAFREGYLVEGDIYLKAEDLKNKPASANLVAGLPRVTTVSVSNLGQHYIDVDTPPCVGEGYKVVNGICEKGTKEWTGSSHAGTRYYCYYHYVFSDGSTSGTYTISSNFPCFNP